MNRETRRLGDRETGRPGEGLKMVDMAVGGQVNWQPTSLDWHHRNCVACLAGCAGARTHAKAQSPPRHAAKIPRSQAQPGNELRARLCLVSSKPTSRLRFGTRSLPRPPRRTLRGGASERGRVSAKGGTVTWLRLASGAASAPRSMVSQAWVQHDGMELRRGSGCTTIT
jgi:hypothetical protein